jgi:hypothetical protein
MHLPIPALCVTFFPDLVTRDQPVIISCLDSLGRFFFYHVNSGAIHWTVGQYLAVPFIN